VTIPGGTNGHEFLGRFDDAVRAIENAAGAAGPGDCAEVAAVAVSHGAAIRTWAALRCRNADGAELSRRGLPNTGVAIVAGSSRSGWLLDGWIEEGTEAIPADAAFNVVAEAD
jgi:broad specificity phosphatase PhoE